MKIVKKLDQLCDFCLQHSHLLVEIELVNVYICSECNNLISEFFLEEETQEIIRSTKLKIVKNNPTKIKKEK